MTTLVWFREDLRLNDNPALTAAAKDGDVLPLYIRDEAVPAESWPPGAASRWWLHHSLAALSKTLNGLTLYRGSPHEVLVRTLEENGVANVVWNRRYDPAGIAQDTEIKTALEKRGVAVRSFNGSLLHEPWEVKTGSGTPFKVYTPFWNACRSREVAPPQRAPKIKLLKPKTSGEDLNDWGLLPSKPNWAKGWDDLWTPGEAGARDELDRFVRKALQGYSIGRDRPDQIGTSRLSPHLHFGEISPRQAWARIQMEADKSPARADIGKFLSEFGWREFCHHLLYHYPDLPERNWRREFDAYPWRTSPSDLKAWQRGRTGYPVVDAGMREMWATGFMHNRVRMITASFLIKHLRIDWRKGEAWFWDTLVDADLANNAANWQWIAGSGVDASPYFRIFNPVIQGQRFDPNGEYVRRWCPELAKLPNKHIHAPFDAPAEVLASAGVVLGKTYPRPIVDHVEARAAAMAGFQKVRAAKA